MHSVILKALARTVKRHIIVVDEKILQQYGLPTMFVTTIQKLYKDRNNAVRISGLRNHAIVRVHKDILWKLAILLLFFS